MFLGLFAWKWAVFRPKMVSPSRKTLPAGAVVCLKIRQEDPVSRILSCAVIPLGAASPRTLISDLPGGFGNGSSRLGAPGRHATAAWLLAAASLPIWSCSVWGLPCPSHYWMGGALLPHHFTLTPALEFTQRRAFPASRAHSGIAVPGSPSMGPLGLVEG